MSEETVTFNLELNTTQALEEIQELNNLFTTYLALARRMGLPDDIMMALSMIQQMRIAAETAYRSIMLLYTASGPIGWAIGLGGIALAGFMTADQLTRRPR